LPNIDNHVVALPIVIAIQPDRDMLRVCDFEKDVLLAGDFRNVYRYLRLASRKCKTPGIMRFSVFIANCS